MNYTFADKKIIAGALNVRIETLKVVNGLPENV